MGWGTFKPLLADATVSAIAPIQNKYKELIKDRCEINRVLTAGREQAEEVAESTLKRLQLALALLRKN